jgi:ketosteroid isomerase-like protein
MSAENVEIVKRTIDAYNRRDLDALRPLNDPDVKIDWSASRGVEAGEYEGIDAALRFLQSWFDAFEEIHIEPESFMDAGESVMVPNVTRFRGREGIEVAGRSAFVFTFRDGRVVRVRLYQEAHEAFKAAGLAG